MSLNYVFIMTLSRELCLLFVYYETTNREVMFDYDTIKRELLFIMNRESKT